MAPPKALRRTTVKRGTVASANACSSLAPWRITPPASCARPWRKPGVSTRTTSGIPNALHVRTNRAAFCEASASMTPAIRRGWLATRPTARPSMRAKAMTMFGAQAGWISSSDGRRRFLPRPRGRRRRGVGSRGRGRMDRRTPQRRAAPTTPRRPRAGAGTPAVVGPTRSFRSPRRRRGAPRRCDCEPGDRRARRRTPARR